MLMWCSLWLLAASEVVESVELFGNVASTDAGEFEAFSFPQVAGEQPTRCLFSGFSEGSGEMQGLYAADIESWNGSRKIERIVSTGNDVFSGFSIAAGFAGFDRSNKRQMTVFVAEDAVTRSSAIFTAMKSEELSHFELRKIVNKSVNVPNKSGKVFQFERFSYASIDGDFVVFQGSALKGYWSGLYLAEISTEGMASVRTIVDYSTRIPSTKTNHSFDFFAAPRVMNGKVVFFASRKSDMDEIEHAGDSKFTPALPGLYFVDLKHIYSTSHEESSHVKVIVDFTTIVPGSTDREHFNAFSDIGFDGFKVAFIGQGCNGSLGVYSYDIQSGELSHVVSARMHIPGKKGLRFKSFPQPPSISDKGIAFLAVDSSSNSGIYFYRFADKSLSIVIRTQDQALWGDDIAMYLGMGPVSLYRDEFLVFYAVTGRGISGIFFANLYLWKSFDITV